MHFPSGNGVNHSRNATILKFSMQILPLLEVPIESTPGGTPPGPIVLSTRIRLARNLRDFPFPGWAKEAQRRDIFARCAEAAMDAPHLKKAYVLDLKALTDLEKLVLVERHLISRELSGAGPGAGVIISRDQTTSVMINEEDHLRLQVLRPGFQFKRVWKQVDGLDNGMEEKLDLAFTPELGFLTACPTNVGTGMRASVMMHLPALVVGSQMEKVIRAVNQLGLAVRGLHGEGTEASGSIFQISNQQTLGESEEEILKRLSSVLHTIVEQEENARAKLIEVDAPKLFDKIGRAYGTVRNAHVLTSAEAMNCLSLLRLAVDLGLLKEGERGNIDRLFIECQPGHVQLAARGVLETEKRDVSRARFLREQLAALEALNFSRGLERN
jgi:protein arginine kinase